MKKNPLYALLLSTCISLAQELPNALPRQTTPTSIQPATQTAPAPTTVTPTPDGANSANTQGMANSDILPLNLGGLKQSNNSVLMSIFDNQNNLVDLSGKKIDDAQQKLVRARFEKYLNSPPATSSEDLSYNKLLVDISQRLAGKGGGNDAERTLDAWRLLFKAEDYPMDDQLCRTIADKVVNFWQTTRKIEKLALQNEALEKDRAKKESGMRFIGNMDRQEFIQMMRGKDATPPPSRDYEIDPIKKRLNETEAKLQENKSYEATSRVNQKLDFQSLIVQFFIQRRYYHAMIANDFYRYLFAAEDGKIEGIDSLKGQVFGGVDIKLTTSTIDALCREAINDTDKAVKAAEYLISNGEIHSATQRMLEAFFIGENLAPVKTFPMDSKRKIMRFLRDTDNLINAVKV